MAHIENKNGKYAQSGKTDIDKFFWFAGTNQAGFEPIL